MCHLQKSLSNGLDGGHNPLKFTAAQVAQQLTLRMAGRFEIICTHDALALARHAKLLRRHHDPVCECSSLPFVFLPQGRGKTDSPRSSNQSINTSVNQMIVFFRPKSGSRDQRAREHEEKHQQFYEFIVTNRCRLKRKAIRIASTDGRRGGAVRWRAHSTAAFTVLCAAVLVWLMPPCATRESFSPLTLQGESLSPYIRICFS